MPFTHVFLILVCVHGILVCVYGILVCAYGILVCAFGILGAAARTQARRTPLCYPFGRPGCACILMWMLEVLWYLDALA